jgi:hypothetical protein
VLIRVISWIVSFGCGESRAMDTCEPKGVTGIIQTVKAIEKDKAPGELFHRRLCQSQLIANCGLVTRPAIATDAAAAIFAWLSLVNLQRAPAQFRAIELLHSRSAFFLR